MKRIFLVELEKCSSKCPKYEYDDGGGHMDPFTMCNAERKELKMWEFVDGFPIWCKLGIVK